MAWMPQAIRDVLNRLGYGSATPPGFSPILEVSQIVFPKSDFPPTQFVAVGAVAAGNVLQVWPGSALGVEEGIYETYYIFSMEAGVRRAYEFQVRTGMTGTLQSGIQIWAYRIQAVPSTAGFSHTQRFRFALKTGWSIVLVAVDGQAIGDTSSGSLGGWPLIS